MSSRTTTPVAIEAPAPDQDRALEPDPALVKHLKDELQLADATRIATFGSQAQREVASFADRILRDTANRGSGPTGDLIASMILNVKRLDPDSLREASFIDRLVGGGIKAKVVRFREAFQSLASQVDRLSLELERNRDVLKRDVAMLDGLFAKCLDQLKFLQAYIVAGGERLHEERRTRLMELERNAASSGTGGACQIVAQQLSDLRQALDRLERRLHDLKLSRVMAMQTLPQIRLIQNGNVVLVEKLQSSLTQTIPAWKQQMTVALALHSQSDALQLQRKVAERLRTGAAGIEQEVQCGIVDVETLAQVQRDFAATLNEVLTIQQEGRAKRLAAEQEMLRIERDLKATLVQAEAQAERLSLTSPP